MQNLHMILFSNPRQNAVCHILTLLLCMIYIEQILSKSTFLILLPSNKLQKIKYTASSKAKKFFKKCLKQNLIFFKSILLNWNKIDFFKPIKVQEKTVSFQSAFLAPVPVSSAYYSWKHPTQLSYFVLHCSSLHSG